jgi:hypothetical protein
VSLGTSLHLSDGRRRPAAGPPGSGPRVQGTALLATVGANCEVAAARRLVIICHEIYRNLVHELLARSAASSGTLAAGAISDLVDSLRSA